MSTIQTTASADPAPGAERGPPPGVFLRLDQAAAFPYTRSEYIRKVLWWWVQTLLVRPSPPRVWRWRFWLMKLFGQKGLGVISPSTRVKHPWLLEMGFCTNLGDRVEVYNLGPVSIGEHTVVSQDAYICAGTHDYTRPDFPLVRASIRIGRGVWIGAGAFIGPGVTIGDNSIVGARAVVMKDVPAGVIVGGNPAEVIKARPMPGAGPVG